MSDTPIAERLAAELGSPWPSRWRMTGWITDEGISMSEPSPKEIEQMRDAAERLAEQGQDTRGIEAVIDLATGVDPGPQ